MEPLALTRKQLAQRRAQAAALFPEDLSNAEIGRRIGMSWPTVSKWRQKWNADHEAGLELRPPGNPARLTPQQVEQITAALNEGAEANGFNTPMWTLDRVSQVIADLTGVEYHPGSVWHLLKEWNWSDQKPEAVAKERDDQEIERFVSEEWPRIKKGRKSRQPK